MNAMRLGLILDEMFKGSQTSRASLNDVVRWAVAAQRVGKLLSIILAADKTAHARSIDRRGTQSGDKAHKKSWKGCRQSPKSSPRILRKAVAPGARLRKGSIMLRATRRAFSVMPFLPPSLEEVRPSRAASAR